MLIRLNKANLALIALSLIKAAFVIGTVLMFVILALAAFPKLLQTESFIAHSNLGMLYILLVLFWSAIIVAWGFKPIRRNNELH